MKLMSKKFGRACPRCRPSLAPAAQGPRAAREVPEDWPSLEEIFTARIPCRTYVPSGAKWFQTAQNSSMGFELCLDTSIIVTEHVPNYV